MEVSEPRSPSLSGSNVRFRSKLSAFPTNLRSRVKRPKYFRIMASASRDCDDRLYNCWGGRSHERGLSFNNRPEHFGNESARRIGQRTNSVLQFDAASAILSLAWMGRA